MDMLPDSDPQIESIFPLLLQTGYHITSPLDVTYNCIGWAVPDMQWWEPDVFFQHYWPASAPREYTPEAYILAYQSVGYEVCNSSEYEVGFEKIAIYIDQLNNQVLHASRQLDENTWTSKLGKAYDISHAFTGLNSVKYATPQLFMRKAKNI